MGLRKLVKATRLKSWSLILALPLLLAACGGETDKSKAAGGGGAVFPPKTHNVNMTFDMTYDPVTIEIVLGDSVTWTNLAATTPPPTGKMNMTHTATREEEPKFNVTRAANNTAPSDPVLFETLSEGDGFEYHCTVKGHRCRTAARVFIRIVL